MISAMPAVAIRRERSKSVERIGPPTRRGRFVEYYHKKISRMGSIRPPAAARSYSMATTPDMDLPAELLVEMDPYEGQRCPRLQRILGYVSLFHAGCVFIAVGLIVLFISMGSVKANVLLMRTLGSFLVALGALLCLLRTVFFRKVQPLKHRLRLRSSESFTVRLSADQCRVNECYSAETALQPTTVTCMRVIRETDDGDRGSPGGGGRNGLRLGSPLRLQSKADSNGTERSPSPLRPTSADKMLPGRDEGEKSL